MPDCKPPDFNNDAFVEYARENVNRVIGAAIALEQMCKAKGSELIADLIDSASRLLTQNINQSYLFGEKLYAADKSVIDCTALLDGIIEESLLTLAATKREINFRSVSEELNVYMDAKAFIVVVMNLLQNALLYSPRNRVAEITLEKSGGDAVITFRNLISSEVQPRRSGFGLPLAEKIVARYGGVFETARILEGSGGTFTARVSLPLVKDAAKNELNSPRFDYSDYISERFKPVNLFLEEVIFQ